MKTLTATAPPPEDIERKKLLWRLRVNMLIVLSLKSETEVSEWIRTWLKNWRPPY